MTVNASLGYFQKQGSNKRCLVQLFKALHTCSWLGLQVEFTSTRAAGSLPRGSSDLRAALKSIVLPHIQIEKKNH